MDGIPCPKLRFGEEYGLQVESEPDEGTTVTIHIPAVVYNEENAQELESGHYRTSRDGASAHAGKVQKKEQETIRAEKTAVSVSEVTLDRNETEELEWKETGTQDCRRTEGKEEVHG